MGVKMTSERLLNMSIKFYTSPKNYILQKQISGYTPGKHALSNVVICRLLLAPPTRKIGAPLPIHADTHLFRVDFLNMQSEVIDTNLTTIRSVERGVCPIASLNVTN